MLASQIAYNGAPDSSKTLELTVANAAGREIGSYYIKSFGENYESARSFRISRQDSFMSPWITLICSLMFRIADSRSRSRRCSKAS